MSNLPLYLDFYGDTMVVVNDSYVADYHATYDSIVVVGDTSFAVRYWFSLDRLLLETAEGKLVTMARQSEYARPIEGLWRGTPIGHPDVFVTIQMWRGGIARRRMTPATDWTDGEWDRQSRIIRFTWMPDSITWEGSYDPLGEALLFDSTEADLGTLVLRKVYR